MKYFTATVVSFLYCLFQPLVLFYVQLIFKIVDLSILSVCKFFKEWADIATTEILSYLAQENICKQLVTILLPHLIRNSLFICNTHKDKIYKVIIELLLMKPLLKNSCSQKTDSIKRKSIANKPISGKVLKL
jgi:hypothetical protein